MPPAWAGHNAWTVLNTAWEDGQHFLDTWAAWRADPARPAMLHYVGIGDQPASIRTDHALSTELQQACWGMLPGFQRISLEGGRITLTLCLGALQAMLAEQNFVAHAIRVGGSPAHWDKWTAKLLTRRCRQGTRLQIDFSDAAANAAFTQAGFQLDPAWPSIGMVGEFKPHWKINTTRQGPPEYAKRVARCAVIGAGLSGASVAQALALRDWQVTVLDAEPTAAQGASGLPAGLVVPHVSVDDNPRARLSRSGIRQMLQHARALLQAGQDWEHTGVLECQPDSEAANRLHDLPYLGSWVQAGAEPNSLWHPHAAWIKPAAQVRAWLAQPGIRFQGNARVAQLVRDGEQWRLLDAQGQELASAELVVFANAMACAALVQSLPDSAQVSAQALTQLQGMHALHGLMSRGPLPDSAAARATLPRFPVNGHGSFLPQVPGAVGVEWLAGATFETQPVASGDISAQHQANFDKLQQLLPAVAQALAPAFAQHRIGHWIGTRCVTHDRLPVVGPLSTAAHPSLWVCAGMGARGLSFAALCAELLAARVGAEPLPVEASLARSLDVQRARRATKPSAAKPEPAWD